MQVGDYTEDVLFSPSFVVLYTLFIRDAWRDAATVFYQLAFGLLQPSSSLRLRSSVSADAAFVRVCVFFIDVYDDHA